MAAIGPKDYTYYSKNCFCAKVSGSDKVIHLYPLAKSAYASDANFKSYFYVDDIFTWKDNESKNCVVGMCTENSDNYNHHAAARRSYMRINKGSTTYQVMNDGGLNTMPHAAFPSTTPSTTVLWDYANYIKAKCNVKSAYFIDTTSFTLEIYKVSGSTETYIHGGYIQPTAGQVAYAAQFSQDNVQTLLKDFVGLSQGDTVRLKVTATNAEGTYTNPNYVQFTVKAPLEFIQVYRHTSQPTSSTVPTSGTAYLMLVDQSRYTAGTGSSGGTFYRLFNLSADSWLSLGAESGGEWLKGAEGSLSAADTLTFSNLPDGYYYGVPTTWNGSTFRYVRIYSNTSSTKQLSWMANPYVATNYDVTISLSGKHNTLTGVYTITVKATLSGSWPSSVTISCPIYFVRRNTVTSASVTVTGSGGASNFTVGTFTITAANVSYYDGIRTGDGSAVKSTGTPATAHDISEGTMMMADIQEDNT